ncbi:tRNA 2-thiouridine(34) synthase MnmA [candidate division FCPU426 bacterium]|nr:tRNA 2-thiouridine(34) synthase MnmA [candidate division FCPU426 bacterium]
MKIAVALSGGVDSSTVARRLQSAGHDVIGITMRLCPEDAVAPAGAGGGEKTPAGIPEHGCGKCAAPCACWDGRQVAQRLGLQHHLVDFRQDFAQYVLDAFVRDYAAGLTPNPCAWCNRMIKFGVLWKQAQDLGAEYLATGHYARLLVSGEKVEVKRALDQDRDQTYFLALVPQEQFRHVLFPLGEEKKHAVAAEARQAGIMPAHSETSNEICFLRDRNYADYLKERIPEAFAAGDIVDGQGIKVGEHLGLPRYTVGQRKGLGVAAAHPLYVIRLLPDRNQVVVGPDAALWTKEVRIRDLNWPSDLTPGDREVMAMIRYRQKPVRAQLRFTGRETARLLFQEPVRAAAPGQVAALYDRDRLLGGGRIVPAEEA